jgi:glutamine amidotransferase PdxT
MLAAYESASLPITNWITRVQNRSKNGFVETGMSSAEIANRVKKHFKAVNLYVHHTVHGSRRGSMQHDVHVLGKSAAEAGEAAQIKTPAIVKRYLDPHRHL